MFINLICNTVYCQHMSLSSEAYLAFYSICAEESFAVSKAAGDLT